MTWYWAALRSIQTCSEHCFHVFRLKSFGALMAVSISSHAEADTTPDCWIAQPGNKRNGLGHESDSMASVASNESTFFECPETVQEASRVGPRWSWLQVTHIFLYSGNALDATKKTLSVPSEIKVFVASLTSHFLQCSDPPPALHSPALLITLSYFYVMPH